MKKNNLNKEIEALFEQAREKERKDSEKIKHNFNYDKLKWWQKLIGVFKNS